MEEPGSELRQEAGNELTIQALSAVPVEEQPAFGKVALRTLEAPKGYDLPHGVRG